MLEIDEYMPLYVVICSMSCEMRTNKLLKLFNL